MKNSVNEPLLDQSKSIFFFDFCRTVFCVRTVVVVCVVVYERACVCCVLFAMIFYFLYNIFFPKKA